jgi:hypothetical protein
VSVIVVYYCWRRQNGIRSTCEDGRVLGAKTR